MGLTPAWIRSAIDEGIPIGGVIVKLEAEILEGPRRIYRIHLDQFVAFLRAIGWKRVPTIPRVRPVRTA